jgi:hypothetical protein
MFTLFILHLKINVWDDIMSTDIISASSEASAHTKITCAYGMMADIIPVPKSFCFGTASDFSTI